VAGEIFDAVWTWTVVIEMVKENTGGTNVDLADEVTDIGGWAEASVEERVKIRSARMGCSSTKAEEIKRVCLRHHARRARDMWQARKASTTHVVKEVVFVVELGFDVYRRGDVRSAI